MTNPKNDTNDLRDVAQVLGEVDPMTPPKYGWKRRADQEFPEKRNPYMKVKISQALPLVPMGARYLG